MHSLEQKKFIDEALQMAESINIKYKLLKTLELSKLKDQVMFENAKKSLLRAWEIEKELYKQNYLTAHDVISLIYYISRNFKVSPNLMMEKIIHNNLGDFEPCERVLFQLDRLVKTDFEYQCQRIKKMVPDFIFDNMSRNDMKRQVKSNFEYQSALYFDYYYVFMSLIDESFRKTHDAKLKEKILHIKYLVPYICTDLEKTFYDQNFEVPNSLYLAYKMQGDFCGFPDFLQNMQVNGMFFQIFSAERDNILKITDDEFDSRKFDATISSFFMRSAAVFLDSEFLADLNNAFIDNVNCYDKAYAKKQEAVNLIISTYDETKKDKSLHKYLSLRKPR